MIAAVLIDAGRRTVVHSGTPLWHLTCEWARFHGLDPNRIPAGSEIVRDAARRRILFEEFAFDGERIRHVDGEPVVTACVEQGEAPPLPFPEVQ